MPRNLNLGPSTLRNRNRVTNKTRLRIVVGNIDADPLVLDEDEEKARVVSTAGVDAEDANEHHLQAVLAASQRHQGNAQRAIRGGSSTTTDPAPVAYIPTPDSTGIVNNYEELYKSDQWTDPATYIRTSETIDAYIRNGLNDQFTYYMDERDKEWLDRNNETARGEGTSAQGAVSTGTTTRLGSSTRSAKAKGKDPEVMSPVLITEDEFELVVGLLEKVTHEKTPFLNHAVEEGQPFPSFLDYQEAFSRPISPAFFTFYAVPMWAPQSNHLVRLARAIYPWWKERRMERGGHRITPSLNYNEVDTANESYICFRHREIKAVRKTRAQQATPSDKVVRLRHEMTSSIEIATALLTREELKREVPQQSQNVWSKRLPIIELKRNFTSLGSKEDDELLVDKDRTPKRPKNETRIGLKLRTRDAETGSPSAHIESIKPKERAARIQSHIDADVSRQKERDRHWEDQVDNAYQTLPVPYHHHLFKYIPPSGAPPWPSSESTDDEDIPPRRNPRAVRLRYGRGGRLQVDRRGAASRLRGFPERDDGKKVEDSESQPFSEEDETDWRMTDRWKYDMDDIPAVGPKGSDEQDRVLIDDFESKYLRHTMTLMSELDALALVTDPSIIIQSSDGTTQKAIPFRLGTLSVRRDPPRPYPPSYVPSISSSQQSAAVSPTPVSSTATPVSVSTPLKTMQPPLTHPLRISNGGVRTPMTQPPPTAANSVTNGLNGIANRATEPDVTLAGHSSVVSNGNVSLRPQPDINSVIPDGASSPRYGPSPSRPKSRNHQVSIPNGYHLPQMNGFQPVANGTPYLHHNNANGLSPAQLTQLKSAFAGNEMAALQANSARLPPSYLNHVVPNGAFNLQQVVGPNINIKIQGTRPMHWPGLSPQQRPVQSGTLDVPMSPTTSLSHVVPVRSPSANGTRQNMRIGNVSGAHVLGAGPGGPLSHPHPSPSPLSQGMGHAPTHPSPPRLSQTPSMMPSPSLQHQQVVGTQGGY